NINVSGTGHRVGNTSTTDSHNTSTSHSHNVYHAPVDMSRQNFQGTTVIGNNNQAVAYIFSRYAYTEEITEMARKVNRLVSLSGCQMPEYTSSLMKKLYFFPGLSE
ncbi:hypothetical protein BaRGS_00028209, partial [Batillaria attramentaria]